MLTVDPPEGNSHLLHRVRATNLVDYMLFRTPEKKNSLQNLQIYIGNGSVVIQQYLFVHHQNELTEVHLPVVVNVHFCHDCVHLQFGL